MVEAIATLVRRRNPVSDSAGTTTFLRQVRLLAELTPSELQALAVRLRELELRRGEILFREGEPGEEMFFVRRGTIIISKGVTTSLDEVLARLGPGEFFGEMSLFDGAPRSATARAETDTELLALDQRGFQDFVTASPRVTALFFHAYGQAVIERLRGTTNLVAEVTRWGLEATGLDLPAA